MSRWEEGAGDDEKNQERVRLWDAASGKEQRRWQAEIVAGSPDGRLTAVGVPAAAVPNEPEAPGISASMSGPRNGAVRLTETATGKEVAVLADCSYWIKSETSVMTFHPVFTPSGRRLLTGGGNTRKIHVWDATTGKRLHSLPTADYFLPNANGVLATADDRFLLVEEVEEGLALVHTDTGKLHRRLESDVPARTLAGTFSPDGKLLALPYRNNAVIFWETMTGAEVLRLTGFQGEVNSLAFSADGKRLATGFRDGSALVWDVAGQAATNAARLSDAETARLWSDLAWADPIKARQAMLRLGASANTVAWLAQRLQPARAPEPQRLAKLIADLDSERFPVRQQAESELEKLETTGPLLRQALATKPSLELRQRLEQLLQKLDDPALVGSRKQALRGIEVLESIGTPAARKLLATLAAGDQSARLTQEAQAAVERLARR